MAVREAELARELSGLDALEAAESRASARASAGRVFSSTWPKVAAIALAIALWQLAVVLELKPRYALPPPGPVFGELIGLLQTERFWQSVGVTARRAIYGYSWALLVGAVIGIAVVRVKTLRTAVGAMITGLQTMPSIAWFPLAILLFQLSEQAIAFVVVLGAAPSIANGIISGVDHVPPILLRAGRMVGADGIKLYRHVVLPAALPACVAGLKQGWAFAWRSLMAGELIVIIANRPSLGAGLQFARELSDAEALMAHMIVILVVGIVADVVFTRADRTLRARRGLLEVAA